jgi:hypothetical protein
VCCEDPHPTRDLALKYIQVPKEPNLNILIKIPTKAALQKEGKKLVDFIPNLADLFN